MTVDGRVVMHVQEHAEEHARGVKAIAVVIVSVTATKLVKEVVKNHVVVVALILVQEVQNNRESRKPYRVGENL